ncbi:hypothetical protein MIND_01079100 [Mycena indigotica]|uniref:amidophosphoribosyltransferase n=1 Tax=Mycena indigotica TaxID=2126181 RepID=A0A8H6SAW7_9AGAR|nr:uncharacterized protein MIND_01079100 [Mycena indigotica]KAF7295395.1 hypothetical protein MIND_01079100 [Mycena indigotica]
MRDPSADMQQATHPRLHVRNAHDAHVVFEAVRQGFLRPITRRLDEKEKSVLIRSGAVFVWEESENASGLKRWTDGRLWSQSRMREPYLFYDEKLGDEPEPSSFQTFRFVNGPTRGVASSSAVSHQERSANIHRGLVKQAYSAWVVVRPNTLPRKWHIVAYFIHQDLPLIPTVDQDICLRSIIVPNGLYRTGKARDSLDEEPTVARPLSRRTPSGPTIGGGGPMTLPNQDCDARGRKNAAPHSPTLLKCAEFLAFFFTIPPSMPLLKSVRAFPFSSIEARMPNGMVRDVFDSASISRLIGGMGVGHTRYPTAGSFNNAEAQPFYVNSPYGIVFAHNGNLINTSSLLQYMDAVAHRHINTSSDSELLLNIFANNLQQTGKFRINEEDIFTALGGMMQQVKGAYACVAMLAGFGIMAFRDPNGIRPVGMALRKSGNGHDYLFASESVVADAGGFSEWRDVKPGEAIIITRNGVSRRQVAPPATFAPDMFEYVYFARPDSVLDGISVYRSRMAMGDALADQVQRVLAENNLTVDVVIPVPDTSRVAALNLAQKLQLPYREGFIKNRYVGRTFIMPGQEMRKKNVRRKLNAMALEFVGKNVLIVDDSIVRGTTSKEIIQMAKDVGAKKVIVASCAPPIRYPNVYGIDMPSRRELVAFGRDTKSIAATIGADLVIFQSLPDLIESVRQFNRDITTLDCSVFTGDYVTGGVDEDYLGHLESLREDNARGKAMGMVDIPPANKALVNGINHQRGSNDVTLGSGAPIINGSDHTVGLHNSYNTI